MKIKDIDLVKSVLGEDFFEELNKYEIFKPETKTVVDPEEIRVALQIVPRMVLSYLFANLKWREAGDVAKLELPFAPGVTLNINKKGNDNYHGDVVKDGNVISRFQHRSLPSIGLILLTSLELYDLSLLDEIKESKPEPKTEQKLEKLQDVIDNRLNTHRLIQDVVDRRISEREAINRMIRENLHAHIIMVNSAKNEEGSMQEDKKSKLKLFLESREQRRQESVEMDKNEEIKCPDCDTLMYKNESQDKVKLCICYGEHSGKNIKFFKADDGKVKFKFPKWFDIENIEMLLDALKNK